MKILVTGANGYVGTELVRQLKNKGVDVISLVRSDYRGSCISEVRYINDFYNADSWDVVLDGIDIVIHLIARTHNTSEKDSDSYVLYQSVNVEITKALCTSIRRNQVRRLIYLSSVKVNGEVTEAGNPFTEKSLTNPEDNYGITKLEAESLIKAQLKKSDTDYVIVRPALIYGEATKGNLKTLVRLIQRGIPLPFGCVSNARSMVSLQSLVCFLVLCLDHSDASNKTFLLSNNRRYSTSDVIRKVAAANQLRLRLFCFPTVFLKAILYILGKKDMSKKLFANLEVNNSVAKATLNWQPEE